MKKLLLLNLTLLGLLDVAGCGGGIEPGFAEKAPTTVTAPPAAEKPVKYKTAGPPPGMPG
ncbi:MAG: hypothetical protein P4L84_35945 [Isosphaeraceae bacterium]|nr:hypothetical protein [Isosphaeraceae bacterium]